MSAGDGCSLGLKGDLGDLDANGDVDVDDWRVFRSAFGRCEGDPAYVPAADDNGDRRVTLVDCPVWLAYYGAHQGPAASVPEGTLMEVQDVLAEAASDVQPLEPVGAIDPRVPVNGRQPCTWSARRRLRGLSQCMSILLRD